MEMAARIQELERDKQELENQRASLVARSQELSRAHRVLEDRLDTAELAIQKWRLKLTLKNDEQALLLGVIDKLIDGLRRKEEG